MRRILFAMATLILAMPASAQDTGPADPRIREITWSPGLTLSIEVESGGTMALMVPAGERIQRALVGEAGLFEVTVPSTADILFVRPLGDDVHTGMSVETDQGSYAFELHTGFGASAARVIRLRHFEAEGNATGPAPVPEQSSGSWSLRGDEAVRPSAISDDGSRIWIEFDARQALPAIFAIGPGGEEEVVNGYMRDGLFVIDRVHERLVFRIDRERAEARRSGEKG